LERRASEIQPGPGHPFARSPESTSINGASINGACARLWRLSTARKVIIERR
jgi:hypothetical protein